MNRIVLPRRDELVTRKTAFQRLDYHLTNIPTDRPDEERTARDQMLDILHVLVAFGVFLGALYLRTELIRCHDGRGTGAEVRTGAPPYEDRLLSHARLSSCRIAGNGVSGVTDGH